MKKIFKSKWSLFLTVIMGTIISVIVVLITPMGHNLVKNLIQLKVHKYLPNSKIVYLDYGINNFSLNIKYQKNILKIYGQMIPLNAMFESKIRNLQEILKDYRGKMNLNGKVYEEGGFLIFDGIASFAKSYLNFKVYLSDERLEKFNGSGNEFSIQDIFYMTYIDFPFIRGKTDMEINKTFSSPFLITFNSSGFINKKVSTDFSAITKIKMKNINDLDYEVNLKTDLGEFLLKGKKVYEKWAYDFKSDNLNLKKLKPVLLYPFAKKISLIGSYDSVDNIYKFKNEDFDGYKDGNIKISFKMSSNKFFEYLGFKRIFTGIVSGTLNISGNNGHFDIVSDNSVILSNFYTKKIKSLIGLDISGQKIGRVFMKGYFDNNHVNFDILSSDKNITFSVKNGIFDYKGRFDFILYIRQGSNVYKLRISNNKVDILEKKDVKEVDEKVMVF